MGRGINIPWIADQYTMGRVFDTPWVRCSKYHMYEGRYTMAREGQYTMGSGLDIP